MRVAVESVDLNLIPEAERQVSLTGEVAATAYAVARWIVPNDEPQTILYGALVAGFDFQMEFFCREVSHCRTVFVNEAPGGYVAAAWCDSPPGGWQSRTRGERGVSTSS